MASTKIENLAGTEHLIVTYLRSHLPEECMLDKISMGIGKSRATVLKYLWTLHAKGIIDYREIGRNKLWMMKQPQEAGTETIIREEPESRPPGVRTTAQAAFKLHNLLLREAELRDSLDLPETAVLTIGEDLFIIARNRLFESLFPAAEKFSDLVHQSQAAKLENLCRSANAGTPASIELDLLERAGIYRSYRFTLVPGGPADSAGARVLIGEDLSGGRRTRRHLESLLYIIRTAATAQNEEDLLRETLRGVRENLVPFVHGSIVMADMHVAFTTASLSGELLQDLSPLLEHCMTSLETVSEERGDGTFRYAVAVPIIDEEQATGAMLLLTESSISATEVENIEIVADEIASALRMQRLDRERAEFVNTLLAMNSISTILNTATDEEAILEKSIEAVINTLGFDMGCIYLKDDAEGMVPRVQRNMPEHLRKMCIAGIYDGLFDRVFRDQTLVYVVPGMPEYEDLVPRAIRENGVRTLLILPIKVGDQIVGLVNMGSRAEKHYTQTSLDNLLSIGLQLGIALERSRLASTLGEAGGESKKGE
ncbi:GAF domain-containing protein [Methanolacinia petrolearia]|uniref:GAF domain-containing protein n=1 Tax=Methanolacinia petrolearia TaxID=54120 RepID=UPI003BAB7544